AGDGPVADQEQQHACQRQQRKSSDPVQQIAERKCCQRAPRAGGGGQQADVEEGGDQAGHARTSVAVASAAMPSPRPVKPSRSDVVAFTLIRSASMPVIRAISSRMAMAYG